MSQNTGGKGSGYICHPNIVNAGLPQRAEVILQRERNMFPLIVSGLQGNRKGIPEGKVILTVEMLEEAFHSQDSLILSNVAFLAGRCQADMPGFLERMKFNLRNIINTLTVDEMDTMVLPFIQAAMSLALLGEIELARRVLTPLVKEKSDIVSENYLAAFYLAQIGDPSGYPSILKTLSSNNEHYRLMAARQLIGFKPYQGQIINGTPVDIQNELIKRLKDKSVYVRLEAPHLLAEAGIENLKEILLSISKNDKNKEVRQAALDELEEPG
jgi:hypothetical protein